MNKLAEGVDSIAIVGLEKNTGKTTVLNHLIASYEEAKTLFLTSIGYDGESLDQVTGTDKPRIFVSPGSLVATARSLLPKCSVEKEILDTTGIATAMGEVILFRALDYGYVELAGPAGIQDMKRLVASVQAKFDGLTLIDGALSRVSSAGHGLTQACLLCTGASVSPSFATTMAKTLMVAKQLMFPRHSGHFDFSQAEAYLVGDEITGLTGADGAGLSARQVLSAWGSEPTLALSGLLSDKGAKELLAWRDFKNKRIILEDPTRLMVTPATFDRLMQRKIDFQVLTTVKLLGICLNPSSPRNWPFDEARAREILGQLKVPVMNVRRPS